MISAVVGKLSDPMCSAQYLKNQNLDTQRYPFVILLIYKLLQNPVIHTNWVNHLDEIKTKLYLLQGWFMSLSW